MSPCFVGHTRNAYDDGASVVIDVICFEPGFDPADIAGNRPALERWAIDLDTGSLHQRRIDDRPQNLPRVNESLISRPHRYGYAAASSLYAAHDPGTTFGNALIKHDFTTDRSEAHRFAAGAATGEAVFIPCADTSIEDDGYLMAYVHRPERNAADLVILSAQDLAGDPLASIHLPARVHWASTEAGSPTGNRVLC